MGVCTKERKGITAAVLMTSDIRSCGTGYIHCKCRCSWWYILWQNWYYQW